jgi:hypothetical protein
LNQVETAAPAIRPEQSSAASFVDLGVLNG